MRKICSLLLAVILTAGLCVAPASVHADAAAGAGTEFRAVWVSSVINLDYPSAKGLSADALRREADTILNTASALGFNAVILQVRPTGDALYNSALFPWSDVLSGTQGTAPDGGFDPLAYFIEGAHSRDMELHAWINPFRVARSLDSVETLSDNNPAKQNPSWVVAHSDGNLYYNPGIPEVRKLVVDGVREIVENYDVDGVHYDDYFYPGKTFDDAAAYAASGSELSLEDWRRDNINSLIRETQEAVHTREGCRFGVSPQAVWMHRSASSPYGSDTAISGNQTYYNQYADTRRWVLSGWVDYIAPQIYWEIGNERTDYQTILAWWCELVRGTGVDLYVGHSTYQLNGYNSAEAWKGTGEIVRQIEMARGFPEYKGSIHFRYSFIAADAAIATAIKGLHGESAVSVLGAIRTVTPAPAAGVLTVGRPAADTTVNFSHFYIVGASDPALALTVNDVEIEGRTPLGYFSYYAELKAGENVFTFRQGSNTVTRVITVPTGKAAAAAPSAMERTEITAGSAFPELYDEIRAPGETVTLRCTAPIGATVSVRVGGKSYAMNPARNDKPDGGLYATSYTVNYTLPATTMAGRITNCGTPVYTVSYEGQSVSRRATAALLCAAADAPLCAEIISPSAFVYPGSTTSGGPSGELTKGQIDTVSKQLGGQWVLLGSGQWVQRADVRLYVAASAPRADITAVAYTKGEKLDTFLVKTSLPTATSAIWDGTTLTFTIYNAVNAPVTVLPGGALMGRVTVSHSGTKAVYTLTPDDPALFNGHYVELHPDGIALLLKRKPQISAGAKPLEGFSIVVDAGHGGTDNGAPGPLGTQFAEKTVNLYAALKLSEALRSLGAQVLMTRGSDTTVELKSRLDRNRTVRPDLFISLHCNSMEYDVDSDEIRGISLFYREAVSEAFAKSLYDHVWQSLGIGKKGCHKSNLYVCRGFWAPSVIVEMGFINNPYDYEWLSGNDTQNELVAALAEGIVRYFS